MINRCTPLQLAVKPLLLYSVCYRAFKFIKMLHILNCTNEELLTFEILKNYKGHSIRIKPILDIPHIKLYKFGDDKMLINNDIDVKRELHVLFQMFNGFEVDLGIVVQEMVYDKENFEYFINERLKYIGSFLNSL